MIFTGTQIEEAKKRSRQVNQIKKVSELKGRLEDINNFLDQPSSGPIIDFLRDKIDETEKVREEKNLLVVDDYQTIAKEMATEFNNSTTREKLTDIVKSLKYHPRRLKKEFIDTYCHLKVEESIRAIQNGSRRDIIFYLGPDQYRARLKSEIEKEAEERFRTDSLKSYEEEKENLAYLEQIMENIKLLQSFRNDIGRIDIANRSIRQALSMYSKCWENIEKHFRTTQELQQAINKLPQATTNEDQEIKEAASKSMHNSYQVLITWQAEAQAILDNNKYPIDYLENLVKIIQKTWSILLSIMQLGEALASLKIKRISHSYTHGKTLKDALLILEINGGTPIKFTGLRARNLRIMLLKPGKAISTERFNFSSKVEKNTLSKKSDLLQKEWKAMNVIISEEWSEYGFAPGKLDFIKPGAYSQGINPALTKYIK